MYRCGMNASPRSMRPTWLKFLHDQKSAVKTPEFAGLQRLDAAVLGRHVVGPFWPRECIYVAAGADILRGGAKARFEVTNWGIPWGRRALRLMQMQNTVTEELISARRLRTAVVVHAVEDWRGGTLRARREAQDFLFHDDRDFETVCSAAGLDGGDFRADLPRSARKSERKANRFLGSRRRVAYVAREHRRFPRECT